QPCQTQSGYALCSLQLCSTQHLQTISDPQPVLIGRTCRPFHGMRQTVAAWMEAANAASIITRARLGAVGLRNIPNRASGSTGSPAALTSQIPGFRTVSGSSADTPRPESSAAKVASRLALSNTTRHSHPALRKEERILSRHQFVLSHSTS